MKTYTVSEAAALIGCTTANLHIRLNKGTLAGYISRTHTGGSLWRIRHSELLAKYPTLTKRQTNYRTPASKEIVVPASTVEVTVPSEPRFGQGVQAERVLLKHERLTKMVGGWAWNNTANQCAREIKESEFDAVEVVTEMTNNGWCSDAIHSVLRAVYGGNA